MWHFAFLTINIKLMKIRTIALWKSTLPLCFLIRQIMEINPFVWETTLTQDDLESLRKIPMGLGNSWCLKWREKNNSERPSTNKLIKIFTAPSLPCHTDTITEEIGATAWGWGQGGSRKERLVHQVGEGGKKGEAGTSRLPAAGTGHCRSGFGLLQ